MSFGVESLGSIDNLIKEVEMLRDENDQMRIKIFKMQNKGQNMEYLLPLAFFAFILCLIPFVWGKTKKKGSIDPIKNVRWWK